MQLSSVGLAFLSIFTGFCAHASLGGPALSVEHDRNALRGQQKVLSRHGYSIHELTLPEGQTVREYVDASGTVFAVTWQGATQPDLSLLPGDHFQEFQNAQSAEPPPGPRRPSATTRSGNLVVVRSGHMRDLRGKAYLETELPRNLRAKDLR
ncbi:MAG: DUF2844 domain-containing protein [Bdellovibrionota bacterium]